MTQLPCKEQCHRECYSLMLLRVYQTMAMGLFREQWSNIKCADEWWVVVCRMDLFSVFAIICFLFPVVHSLVVPYQLPSSDSELCSSSAVLTVRTPLGTASGTRDPAGAFKFPVKYASANRWAPSTVAATWALPYVFPCVFKLKA